MTETHLKDTLRLQKQIFFPQSGPSLCTLLGSGWEWLTSAVNTSKIDR